MTTHRARAAAPNAVAERAARRERAHTPHQPAGGWLDCSASAALVPLMRMAAGDASRVQLRELWRMLGVPLLAIVVFLVLWALLAPQVQTSLGADSRARRRSGSRRRNLWADHVAERAKAAAFYERQDERNAERLAEDPNAEVKCARYTGKPTYIDQIFTSLKTVFTGFLLATLVAVPLGILCGLSPTVQRRDQSADPDLQAGLAAGLAADRHHGGQRALRHPTTRCSRNRSSSRRSR